MSALHERILEGNGTAASPFVIHTSSQMLSAQIQNQILDRLFGEKSWKPVQQAYSSSPNGLPQNQDLLEYRVQVGAALKVVFFDLFLVTRLTTDPKLQAVKDGIITPELLEPIREFVCGSEVREKKADEQDEDGKDGTGSF